MRTQAVQDECKGGGGFKEGTLTLGVGGAEGQDRQETMPLQAEEVLLLDLEELLLYGYLLG